MSTCLDNLFFVLIDFPTFVGLSLFIILSSLLFIVVGKPTSNEVVSMVILLPIPLTNTCLTLSQHISVSLAVGLQTLEAFVVP